MKAAVAHSEIVDSRNAALDLVETVRSKLDGDAAQAGMLFCACDYDHQVILDVINSEFPGIELIGCTTDGEVSSRLGFCDDSATLIVFAGANVWFRAGLGRNVDKDPKAAVAEAIGSAREAEHDPVICFTTPAGLVVSADAVMREMREKLGSSFPIFGGVAGDDWRFDTTHQFCGTEIVSNGVPMLFGYGDLVHSVGVESGWSPLGEPAAVTKSEGARVYEIEGEQAVCYYQRYLGEQVRLSPEHPLAIMSDDGTFALRAPLLDFEDGSIQFVGDVAEGAKVQLTQATRAEILGASRASIAQALDGFPGTPTAALLFSCAARKQLLGTRTEREYALLEDRVSGIETCGFYTYGEIAPNENGAASDFHNQTFVAVLLGTR